MKIKRILTLCLIVICFITTVAYTTTVYADDTGGGDNGKIIKTPELPPKGDPGPSPKQPSEPPKKPKQKKIIKRQNVVPTKVTKYVKELIEKNDTNKPYYNAPGYEKRRIDIKHTAIDKNGEIVEYITFTVTPGDRDKPMPIPPKDPPNPDGEVEIKVETILIQ